MSSVACTVSQYKLPDDALQTTAFYVVCSTCTAMNRCAQEHAHTCRRKFCQRHRSWRFAGVDVQGLVLANAMG